MQVLRIFDPTFAATNIDAAYVDTLVAVTPIAYHIDLEELKREVAAYKTAAATAVIDNSDFEAYTESLLKFWRSEGHKMKTWSKAARIAFSIPASSCAAERVFALLRAYFGSTHKSALADQIEATLQLVYNKRVCC